jgi:hypothetical protein
MANTSATSPASMSPSTTTTRRTRDENALAPRTSTRAEGGRPDRGARRSSSSTTRSSRCSCPTASSRASARSAARRTSTATTASLRRGLRPDRPEESVLGRLRRDAGAQGLRPLLLPALRSALPGIPAPLDHASRTAPKPAGRGPNKMQEWLGDRGENKLTDWDISRDAPYFGFEIPDAPGKYFYVWLDAPIGYMGSFKQPRRAARGTWISTRSGKPGRHRAVPLHRQGHPLLPRPVLAGRCCTRRLPHADGGVRVHGFLTVDGAKMSKSRGTFITAESYLEAGLNPEWLRYYYAAKLNGDDGGHRPQPRRLRRPRQLRSRRQVRQHRQPLRRLHPQALRRQAGWRFTPLPSCSSRRAKPPARSPRTTRPRVRQGAARDHGAGRRANQFVNDKRPGNWPSRKARKPNCTRLLGSAQRSSAC